MKKASLCVILGVAALAGCATAADKPHTVTPAKYSDFRQYLYDDGQRSWWPGIPEDLQNRMRVCYTDFVLENLSNKDLVTLNSFARGEEPLTDAQYQSMLQNAQAHAGNPTARAAELQRLCPDTLSAMRALGTEPFTTLPTEKGVKHIYPNAETIIRHAIEGSTPDDYPIEDRRQLIDCAAEAVTARMTLQQQSDLLQLINGAVRPADGKAAVMKAILGDKDKATATREVKEAVAQRCPEMASKYPDFID